jgi:hypothetical protein
MASHADDDRPDPRPTSGRRALMRHVATPYAILGSVAAIAGVVGTIALRIVDPVPLLEADVLGVVDRTFHPTQAGLWLQGTSR